MTKRLLKQLTILFSFINLLCLSNLVSAQITTSIPRDTICYNSQFIAPVMIDSIRNIDSINLSIHYNPNTTTYSSFRQINSLLISNGTSTVLDVNDSTVSFNWKANDNLSVSLTNIKLLDLIFDKITEEDSIYFNEDSSYYRDTSGIEVTSIYIGGVVKLFPALSVTIEEIDATCKGSCDANIAAFARGGVPPYVFLWNGELSIFDSIRSGACAGANILEITDSRQCMIDTVFTVSELPVSGVTIEPTPDTVYIQNPVVNFSFTDDESVVDWSWDFGDDTPRSREKNPVHVYQSAATPGLENYEVLLLTVNESGCSDSVIYILPVSETKIFIPNVFTPGNDDVNNYFKIAKTTDADARVPIDMEYIRLELVVFDRWGRKVYDDSNYRNNWDGNNLPQGTYFYRLNTFGYFKDESFKGSVTILR